MQTDRTSIDGRTLEFARIPARRKNSPTLVFLHEGLGSIGLWRRFPEVLAERTGYGALVYSRYGNGFSSALAEPRNVRYMHDEALVALPALLDALKIGDVILVGHSDGASIALILPPSMASPFAGWCSKRRTSSSRISRCAASRR